MDPTARRSCSRFRGSYTPIATVTFTLSPTGKLSPFLLHLLVDPAHHRLGVLSREGPGGVHAPPGHAWRCPGPRAHKASSPRAKSPGSSHRRESRCPPAPCIPWSPGCPPPAPAPPWPKDSTPAMPRPSRREGKAVASAQASSSGTSRRYPQSSATPESPSSRMARSSLGRKKPSPANGVPQGRQPLGPGFQLGQGPKHHLVVLVLVELPQGEEEELLPQPVGPAQGLPPLGAGGREPLQVQAHPRQLPQAAPRPQGEASGPAVVLVVYHQKQVGVPGQEPLRRVVQQPVAPGRSPVKVEAVGGVGHHRPGARGVLPGQPSQHAPHRGVAVDGGDPLLQDERPQLEERLPVLPKEKGGTGRWGCGECAPPRPRSPAGPGSRGAR